MQWCPAAAWSMLHHPALAHQAQSARPSHGSVPAVPEPWLEVVSLIPGRRLRLMCLTALLNGKWACHVTAASPGSYQT